jgi:hypothetical protein
MEQWNDGGRSRNRPCGIPPVATGHCTARRRGSSPTRCCASWTRRLPTNSKTATWICPASHTTIVPSHFNVPPANICTRAVQGRSRYARTRRRSSIPTVSRPLATFSGGGSWAERLLKTAHRRIGFPNAMHRVWGPFPTEGVRFRASPS